MSEFDYELFAIRYATRDAQRSAHFIGGDPHDGPMPMDYFVWVAKGGGRTFVIDTGFNAEVSEKRKRTFLRCPVEALAALGIDANAVEDVILTHLHYDHVGNFDRFPKARFHLQERELAYATGRYMRYPRLSHSFEVEDVCGIVRLNYAAAGDVLQRRRGACAWLDACMRWAAIRRGCNSSGSRPSADLSCSPPTSRISTRTWPAAGRSRRPSISAKCWRALTGCSHLRRTRSHIVPGHDPLVMKLYPAPSPELEGIAVRLDVPPSGVAPRRADYSFRPLKMPGGRGGQRSG